MTKKLSNNSLVLGAALLFVSLNPTRISAQDKMNLSKVAESVYLMENSRGSGNSTFIITDEGVVVFDVDIRTADQTLAAIRKLTDKKVRYIITSHSAGDHATGGWHFREDNPVYIATKNQAKDLFMQEGKAFEQRKASDSGYKGRDLVRPDIAFSGSLTLYFGGLTFQMTDEGHGHSTSDLTVYIPQRRVMLTGDLLDTEIHPGQAESGGVFFANVQGWIDILDRIINRNLAVDTYVPGHGSVHAGRGVEDLHEQKRYFVVMRGEVAKMIQAGKSMEQIQKEFVVPKEFTHYRRPERLRNFLRLFYNQLHDKGL